MAYLRKKGDGLTKSSYYHRLSQSELNQSEFDYQTSLDGDICKKTQKIDRRPSDDHRPFANIYAGDGHWGRHHLVPD